MAQEGWPLVWNLVTILVAAATAHLVTAGRVVHSGKTRAHQTAEIWADQIAIQRRFVTRFRAIGIPAGDRAVAALVQSRTVGVEVAERYDLQSLLGVGEGEVLIERLGCRVAPLGCPACW